MAFLFELFFEVRYFFLFGCQLIDAAFRSLCQSHRALEKFQRLREDFCTLSSMEMLLVFCKNPIRGEVKTRLAADLGETATLAVYEALGRHTRHVLRIWEGAVAVFHATAPATPNAWTHPGWLHQIQQGADLGARMEQASSWAFAQGATKVCLIGSDLWTLQPSDLEQAFAALDSRSVVWGPASDGGYYLLGLTQPQPELFYNLPWSQPELLQQSQARLPKGTRQHLLREQNDIDTLADLQAHPDLYNHFRPSEDNS